MLVFPSETPDASLPWGFNNRDVDNHAADAVVRASALVGSQVDQRLVRYRFYKTVSQEVQRKASGADRLRIGHTLLNFSIGKGRTRADRTIVHQCAAGNDLGATSNGNVWILKPMVGAQMSHAQLSHLTAS